jgi:hypothetical protein
VEFAVNKVDVATPDAFVMAVLVPANVPLAPLAGALNVTTIPAIGLPFASFAVATSGANAVLIGTLCGVPAVAVMVANATMFVKEKFAGLATPATEAVNVNGPWKPFAVKVGAVATPEEFVTAVFAPPANVPDAPEMGGAVNVTVTPLSGLPPPSFTVTTNGENEVLIGVL